MRCTLALWMVLLLATGVAVAQVEPDQGAHSHGAGGHLDTPVVTPQPRDDEAPAGEPEAADSTQALPVEVVEGEVTVEPDAHAAHAHEGGEEHEHASVWFDGVHYVGVTGGIVAFLALLSGLYILLAFAGGKGLRQRMRLRTVHMSAGLVAVLLALTHAAGRAVQHGSVELGLGPSQLTVVFFVLAAVIGFARHRPPAAMASKPTVLVWLHRIAVVGVLVLLILHASHEYSVFAAH